MTLTGLYFISFQYVTELDPDIMKSKTFGASIKTHLSLILFLPMNVKDMNKKLLHTVCNSNLCFASESISTFRMRA